MVGIVSYGCYIPRLRLQRAAIGAANKWFAPGLLAMAKGERSMANWDEDSITMGVEASRDCLAAVDRGRVKAVSLASTRLPFAERENAGILKEALNLPDDTRVMDFCSSLRAGTSALMQALYASRGGGGDQLCVASEKRHSKAASEAEMTDGDGAAALLIGSERVIARLLASDSVSVDFVSQFRDADSEYDYAWESRWVREEGYGKIIPKLVKSLLSQCELKASDIHHLVVGVPSAAIEKAVADKIGLSAETLGRSFKSTIGFAGAADPLLLLTQALGRAKPGERILVVGFGQGCDALLFEATDAIADTPKPAGLTQWTVRRKAEENYLKYLAFSGQLDLHKGMRAEMDQKPVLTALYRHRKTVLGLIGGRCRETGTVQFPRSEISVYQEKTLIGTQEDYPLAEKSARIMTYTSDSLTYSPDPPAYYGMIEFEGGGRMVAEFADVDEADVEVGAAMRMVFRIKAVDELRGFTKYFWKATAVEAKRPANQGEVK
jgi:hydroxymethylglutaryl-CoA synthase